MPSVSNGRWGVHATRIFYRPFGRRELSQKPPSSRCLCRRVSCRRGLINAEQLPSMSNGRLDVHATRRFLSQIRVTRAVTKAPTKSMSLQARFLSPRTYFGRKVVMYAVRSVGRVPFGDFVTDSGRTNHHKAPNKSYLFVGAFPVTADL